MEQHPYLGKSVLHVTAPYWRNIRSSVAGVFTSAKLKQMMPALEEDANVFLHLLERYANTAEEVHMLRMYEPLAMELTGKRCFGTLDRYLGNPDHPLICLAKQTAHNGMTGALHMVGRNLKSRALTIDKVMTSAATLCLAG
ncbi:hypothetical protein V5799_020160, partial [Amblyomma americanum]